MERSTICLTASALMGAPAWYIDINTLPSSVQLAWLIAMLIVALTGGAFWAFDRK